MKQKGLASFLAFLCLLYLHCRPCPWLQTQRWVAVWKLNLQHRRWLVPRQYDCVAYRKAHGAPYSPFADIHILMFSKIGAIGYFRALSDSFLFIYFTYFSYQMNEGVSFFTFQICSTPWRLWTMGLSITAWFHRNQQGQKRNKASKVYSHCVGQTVF